MLLSKVIDAVLLHEERGDVLSVADQWQEAEKGRHYITVERELLSVVDSIKQLNFYLFVDHFTQEVDHTSIEFQRTSKISNS